MRPPSSHAAEEGEGTRPGNTDVKRRSLNYHGAMRAWRNGIRSGLKENLSARRETGGAELLKFGEPCNGNPEPRPDNGKV
jgi:hypothetical protein